MIKKYVMIFFIGMAAMITGCENTDGMMQAEIMTEEIEADELDKITIQMLPEASIEPGFEEEAVIQETEEIYLSDEMLDFYTEFVNASENNGFLASKYEDIRDVELDGVFYNGAGVEKPPVSEELLQAYLQETSREALETDLEYLSTEEINTFLKEKTGYDLSQMKDTLHFIYVEEYDTYFFEHGDTNYQPWVCIDGFETTEGEIMLICMSELYEDEICELTLRREGDRLLFVSNCVVTEESENTGQLIFENYTIEDFVTDADISFIKDFTYAGNYEEITPENLYGIWYDASFKEALQITEEGCLVYIPYLNYHGSTWYQWEIEDRSSKGLCPALKIYTMGPDKGALTYYINGVTDEVFWSNTQSQIFYKQKERTAVPE